MHILLIGIITTLLLSSCFGKGQIDIENNINNSTQEKGIEINKDGDPQISISGSMYHESIVNTTSGVTIMKKTNGPEPRSMNDEEKDEFEKIILKTK